MIDENINEEQIRSAIMEEEALNDKVEDDEDIEREAKAISEQKRVVRYLEQISGFQESSDEEAPVEREEQMFELRRDN